MPNDIGRHELFNFNEHRIGPLHIVAEPRGLVDLDSNHFLVLFDFSKSIFFSYFFFLFLLVCKYFGLLLTKLESTKDIIFN